MSTLSQLILGGSIFSLNLLNDFLDLISDFFCTFAFDCDAYYCRLCTWEIMVDISEAVG